MLKALSKATKQFKVGGPEEEGVMIGPLQNKMQFDKIKAVYEEVEKGGYAVEKGQQVDSKGFFLQPIIIDNPPNDASIMLEEQMVSASSLHG
jgi:acyl-CoA reductase-like NAD-dependent aldehyde dehydrogenase